MSTPRLIDNPDMSAVIEAVQKHIEYMDSADYHEDNDDAHYVFETAVEACYGKGVWEWYRGKQE